MPCERRARPVTPDAHPGRALQLPRVRRLQQLSGVQTSGRDGGSRAQRPQPHGPMMSSRSIVVTGAGAVCGAGLTVEAIWNAIQSGRSAVAPVTQWDSSNWPVRVAAEVTGVD